MGRCTRCGGSAGLMMSMCDACIDIQNAESRARQLEDPEVARQRAEAERARQRAREQAEIETIRRLPLTTASDLAGHQVIRTIDIVTAECAYGMNVFRDMFAGVSDVFGGRSETTQRALREARETVLLELRREAFRIGANAVIAVDLDYSEFSGQGKSMLFLVASGTGVETRPAGSGVGVVR